MRLILDIAGLVLLTPIALVLIYVLILDVLDWRLRLR